MPEGTALSTWLSASLYIQDSPLQARPLVLPWAWVKRSPGDACSF